MRRKKNQEIRGARGEDSELVGSIFSHQGVLQENRATLWADIWLIVLLRWTLSFLSSLKCIATDTRHMTHGTRHLTPNKKDTWHFKRHQTPFTRDCTPYASDCAVLVDGGEVDKVQMLVLDKESSHRVE